MAFATDTELIQRIEKITSDNRESLSVSDHALISRRNAQAYDTILAALSARGVSKSQADGWARGKEFQLDIATYWVLVDLYSAKAPNDKSNWISLYNREAELKTVELLDASGAEVGSASTGFAFREMNLEEINNDLGV